MLLHQDEQKVHKMITEAITMLCRNGLDFTADITVEGLLGITLDSKEVFLVNIKEKFHTGESDMKDQSSEVHTSTREEVQRSPSNAPESHVNPRGSRRGPPCGIFTGPITPMMAESPFRRQRGHRRMMGGLRWMRKRLTAPHMRLMHAMMSQQQGSDQGYDTEFGQPPFAKRQNLSEETSNFSSRPESTITTSSSSITSMPIKVEPLDDSEEGSMIEHSDVSVSESPWYGSQSGEDIQLAGPLTPSSVATIDSLNDTYDDLVELDPNLLTRVKRAIMKEDGCFVTVRMLCRRYSAFFKSNVVIGAMKHITVPVDSPQHIGAFRILHERTSKIFYKCPPERIHPEVLALFNLTQAQYEKSFSCLPRPVGMHNPRWALFTDHVLANNPYGSLQLRAAPETKAEADDLSVEPGSTMDEFKLQMFIVHSPGCFLSSRILCRKLSKQYRVINVIRAMKAMTRSRTDPNYIGQFVKVSERIKIFFKAPPAMMGSTACQLYNMTEEEYKTIYYSSPRPLDGSVSNWDVYVENAMAHYPYPFENFPIECCHVSPEVMEKVAYVGHGQTSLPSQETGSLTGLLGMLQEDSTTSMAQEDPEEAEKTMQRIREIFGTEVVQEIPASQIDLPPAINIQDLNPEEVIHSNKETS